jgi:riboflavin kinase/FMN adenylyltransferase
MLKGSSCALGMFDGVHLGHQEVINSAINNAQKFNIPSVVLSFSTHPQVTTSNTPTPQLTLLEDRLARFEELGVDIALILEFDKSFSMMSAEDYVEKLLCKGLHVQSISIGFDHRFGRGKRGNHFLLQEMGTRYRFTVCVIPPVSIDGQIISSSVIRKLLKYGDIKTANNLLGREFVIKGCVVEGAKRGRTLGFPTANIKPYGNILIPACGVYAVDVQIENSSFATKYKAVLNVGYRPTFSDREIPTLETYIINFNQNVYQQEISITFKDKIRDEKKFNTTEDLICQIKQDIETAYHLNPLDNKVFH